MKIEDAKALSEVFRKIAQQQAFVFPEPCSLERAEAPSGCLLEAEISFHGHSNGTIRMAMPEEACDILAENVLGLEPGRVKSMKNEARDAIAELLNILCGQFLTTVEGDKPVFNLSVPKISVVDEASWDALRQKPGCQAALVEDFTTLLCLEL